MRKHEWKKILSAVVAASMVFSLTPVNVGAASAQTKQKTVSEAREAAQSMEDVLDQAVSDASGSIFGAGVTSWYFSKAINGVVDAGTLYLKGTEGTETITSNAGRNWNQVNSDKPIKALIVKNANIGNGSFANLDELNTVKLEGVTTVESSGFAMCSNLQQIDLGDALTALGGYVFQRDTSLTHIRIPAGVSKLQGNLFSDCKNLRDVAICTTEAQPELGDTNASTFAKTQSLIYVESGRGGMVHPFIGCSDLTIYVATRGNGIETAMDFTYKDFVAGTFNNNSSLSSVTYSFATLDKYDAKQEVTGELVVSCSDVATGEQPTPIITKNETGIADSNVTWQYYSESKSSISADTVTNKMGKRYVRAVIQDETHFTFMGDFVPFEVVAPVTYTVEDGVLKIAPKPGIEKCVIPDYDDPIIADIFPAWRDEEYSKVEIADGITSIGAYAFSSASRLKTVVLGKDVTSIGQYAFNKSGLEALDLSATGVTSIGNYAFANCNQLTKVSLPEKLESIGQHAFRNCSSLLMVEGLERTKLTEISNYLFYECSSLNNILLPASVAKVGNFAFQNCTNLLNVIFQAESEGDANIGTSAFSGCTSLENVLLSGKNVTIGGNAFRNCSALKKVTIKGVTGEDSSSLSITSSAFNNVTATIYVPNTTVQTAARSSLSSQGVYQGDADKEEAEQKIRVIAAGDDSNIAVKKLGYLTIKLEESELEPGQAFAPSAVEKSGDGAITYWYYKMEDSKYVLVDPDSPATVPSQMGTYYIEGRMAATDTYYACVSNRVKCAVNGKMTEETFDFDSKTGVLLIKKDMSDFNAIKAVFSDYQTRIKEVSWAESEELYKTIPNFADCTELVKVEGIPTVSYGSSFTGCTSLTDVTFSEDYIRESGDGNCIPEGTFSRCTSLKEIVIPDAVNTFSGVSGRGVFLNCTSLEKVIFGKNSQLKKLGYDSFSGCTSLKSIDIPATIEYIAEEVFKNCASLKEVNFLLSADGEGSLREIKSQAFMNCTSLEKLVLPKGIGSVSIGRNAFAGCSALTTVEMNGYFGFDGGVFKDCTKLNTMKFYLPGSGESGSGGSVGSGALTNAGTEAESFVVTMPGNLSLAGNGFEGSGITEVIWEDANGYANAQIRENALAGCSRLKTVILKEMNYTAENAPGIVNKNFTEGSAEDLVIYASGDTYALLINSGYTNVVDYKTVTDAKKKAFAVSEEIYKGLDATLYDQEALKAFLEDTLILGKEMVEEATGADSTLNVFEQADIIDQVEVFLAEAYFGEGGLAEVPAAAVAALTKELTESDYTAESWKALTDAQAAVATFLETKTEGATSAQVSEFEALVKAAMAVELVERTEVETPAPEESAPAPGQQTPAPGQDTPAPGQNTPAPGQDIPAPGQNTPAPGQATQAPGQQTPGQNTPAPEQPQALAAVKIAKVTAKKKSAVVKWKKTAGANGYQLAYGLKKNFKGAKKVTVKVSKTTYTIKKLKKGKVYYIRIRAYKTSSGKKQYGKWSGTKKVKIKK